MGTNYYEVSKCEHQGQHIGKRSAAGRGRMVFTWAVDPELLVDVKGVEDTYGQEFTLEEFSALLEECSWSMGSVGVEFS